MRESLRILGAVGLNSDERPLGNHSASMETHIQKTRTNC